MCAKPEHQMCNLVQQIESYRHQQEVENDYYLVDHYGNIILLQVLLCMLEVLEVMRCALLSMLEAVKGTLCLLEASEVPRVMRCVLLNTLEGGLCLLEVWEVLEVPEVMRCVLLCMLEAVKGALCCERCRRCRE